jgi:hypothetical protein
VLRPALDRAQSRVAAADDTVWALRGQQRRNLGLHAPHRPTPEAAVRLEQMYDDD